MIAIRARTASSRVSASRPSVATPLSAANRKPGWTWRESAVIPAISGLAMSGLSSGAAPSLLKNAVGAASGANSSVIFNLLAYEALDLQGLFDLGRIFVLRRDAEQRRDALDDAAGGRRDGPAGSRITVAFLVAVRLVDQGQHDVLRIVHRERPDKRRDELFLLIVAVDIFFRRAG